MFGELGAMALDRALQRLRLADDVDGESAEHRNKHDEHARQPPVHEQCQRQQDEQRDGGGTILAEKRQPQAGHPLRAFEHDFQKPPGMIGAVEAQGQVEHMVEIIGHDGEPAPMRQAVGVQRDEHARKDRENAERRPGDEPGEDIAPRMRGGIGVVAAQPVDDSPE